MEKMTKQRAISTLEDIKNKEDNLTCALNTALKALKDIQKINVLIKMDDGRRTIMISDLKAMLYREDN